ncbi:MAG: hypothetical protein ACXVKA_05530 [Acidimicrobiia bacterium]
MRTIRYWLGIAILAVVCAVVVVVTLLHRGPSPAVGPPPVTVTHPAPAGQPSS